MYGHYKKLLFLQSFPRCPVSEITAQKNSLENVNILKTRGCCQAEKDASLTLKLTKRPVSALA
jgi:hypothetical protein